MSAPSPRTRRIPLAPALFAALFAALASASARADIVFTVIVNDPQALANTTFGAGAPYALDFTLTSAGNTNTATISDFNLGGGSVNSSTISTTGGASGDINSPPGSVTVTDDVHVNPSSGAFNDFNEQFTPGSASVRFTVDLTTSYVSGAPDRFTFSILDQSGNPIPTTDTTLSEYALLGFNITGPSMTLSDIETYSATSSGATITVAAIPEPSTLLLGALGIVGHVIMSLARRRRTA